ncbi:MAG TPA: hypothetical protein PKG82_06230, partial [Myxococcota bacterium]|nr:hypothetical protein [Myxococcota bacterium]
MPSRDQRYHFGTLQNKAQHTAKIITKFQGVMADYRFPPYFVAQNTLFFQSTGIPLALRHLGSAS